MGASVNSFWKPPKVDRKQRRQGLAVSRSGELIRVRDLPRRDLATYDKAFAEVLSRELVRPGSTFRLRPMQAAMLVEAVEASGVFGMLGVGYGKTVCAPLFGKVLDVERFVLLVPPAIKKEIVEHVIPRLRREIDGIVLPTVVSYNELSRADTGDILDRLRPQLIVADEVHNLKNKGAAQTKRFLRYFDENPDTMLVALSGTITRKSIRDFAHIIQITHKMHKCPITRAWKELQDWANALDPQVPEDVRMNPGALLELCEPGEDVRSGFRRRLIDTEGVVAGDAEDVGASLVCRKLLHNDTPAEVVHALKVLRTKWETPGGEQVVDALDFARKARELSQGFYYVWDWPDGKADKAWLTARKEWRAAVASVCKLNREGLDSELLVRNACRRALGLVQEATSTITLPKASRAEVLEAFKAWHAQAHKEEPETRAVWISDWLVKKAIQWTKDNPLGIVWFDARAVGERAAQLGGNVCGPGNAGHAKILALSQQKEPPTIFASSTSHGTGKNLQAWCNMLIFAPWSGGATWTQVLGREHRPGQDADEVRADVNAHTPELREAIRKAIEQSEYIQETTGSAQKMIQASWQEAA